MGGGGSKPAPPPANIIEAPYPTVSGLTNLSISGAAACKRCDIGVDTKVTISSVKLSRDFGNVSSAECGRYTADLAAVRRKEMSFSDFFTKLQAGSYTRPVSESDRGQFCEQVMFSEEDAAAINSIEEFDANVGKLKSIRIRKVTGSGGFSSGTKAKYTFSIPIKVKYVSDLVTGTTAKTELRNINGKWTNVTVPAGQTTTPVYKEISVSGLTLYHPSPVRIENVQHDAVVSLNDPGDPGVEAVILIPLKGASIGDSSEDFLNKIVKHVVSIGVPDSVTGQYQTVDIPTGSGWNIKHLFWLGETGSDNIAKVSDAFFTWDAAATFVRTKLSESSTEIRFGWKPEGRRVRYFMLEKPVNISLTDLSLLTRNLPPTPPEDAIHVIPDPAFAGNQKPLYRKAEGKAAEAGCGVVRERMTDFSQEDIETALGEGQPLNTCDPFAMNAVNHKKTTTFTPIQMVAILFNVLLGLSVLFGVWIAMSLIVLDYDGKYKKFAEDAGKVVGTLIKQSSGTVTVATPAAAPVAAPSAVENLLNVGTGLLSRRKSGV